MTGTKDTRTPPGHGHTPTGKHAATRIIRPAVTTGQDIEQRAAVALLIEHADDLPAETLAAHVAVELGLPVTDALTGPIDALRTWTGHAHEIEASGEGPARQVLGDDWHGDVVASALDQCAQEIDAAWAEIRAIPTAPQPGDLVRYTGDRPGEHWDQVRAEASIVTYGGGWVDACGQVMRWSAPPHEVQLVARAVYVPVDGAR